ncbi:MAG: HD domain-containing protein, partial [Thermoleophilaceae bacterium]|nr:HD domain-containing protein [Thermoleophilaceae bacterium]
IREHTVAGQQIVQSVPELHEVARLVRHSHERWDGAGYPDGLAGEQIPLASRIVFCADAFHAIRSDRPYRRGRNADAALDEVKRSAGSQFDPEVVDALVHSAGKMRNTVRGGAGGLATSLRSRRLASLLLTLAIGGRALAAGGSYLLRDEGDAGAEKTAPATATARDTGGDGSAPKGKPPAKADQATRTKADQATRTHPAGTRSRPRRDADAGLSARSERPAASTPAAGGPGHLPTGPTGPTRRSAAPPASPGRSGEAPRRPAQPGIPIGGAPGRSEEAPGRPIPQSVDSPGPTGRSPGGR